MTHGSWPAPSPCHLQPLQSPHSYGACCQHNVSVPRKQLITAAAGSATQPRRPYTVTSLGRATKHGACSHHHLIGWAAWAEANNSRQQLGRTAGPAYQATARRSLHLHAVRKGGGAPVALGETTAAGFGENDSSRPSIIVNQPISVKRQTNLTGSQGESDGWQQQAIAQQQQQQQQQQSPKQERQSQKQQQQEPWQRLVVEEGDPAVQHVMALIRGCSSLEELLQVVREKLVPLGAKAPGEGHTSKQSGVRSTGLPGPSLDKNAGVLLEGRRRQQRCVTAAMHRTAVLWRERRSLSRSAGQGHKQQQQQQPGSNVAGSGSPGQLSASEACRQLLELLLPASLALMQVAGWREIATQLWALAVLRHTPPAGWLEAMMARASGELGFAERGGADERCLALSLWALARLGCRPRKRWLKRCREGLLQRWSVSEPRYICLTVWSLAKMGDQPPEQWLQFTLWRICPHMVLYSTAQAQSPAQDSTATTTTAAATTATTGTQQQSQQAHQQQQAQLVPVQPLGQPYPPYFDDRGLLLRAAPNLLAILAERAALQAGAQMKQAMSVGALPADVAATLTCWFRELRHRSLYKLRYGGLSGQQYAMLLYSLAALRFQPSEKWIGAWYAGSGALLAKQCLLDMARLRLPSLPLPAHLTRPAAHTEPGGPASMVRPAGSAGAGAPGRRWQQGLTRGARGRVKGHGASGSHVRGGIAQGGEGQRPALGAPLDREKWQQVMQLLQQGQRVHGQQGRQGQGKRPDKGQPVGKPGQQLQEPELVRGADIACLLWCLARTQLQPPMWWTRLLEAAVLPRLTSLSTQELVTLLHGFGALRRNPSRVLMRGLMQLLRARAPKLGPRGVADVMVAFARLKRPVPPGWVRGLLRAALTDKSVRKGGVDAGLGAARSSIRSDSLRATDADLDPADLETNSLPSGAAAYVPVTFLAAARLLWALGKLGVDPGPSIAQVLMEAVAAEAPDIEREGQQAMAGVTAAVAGTTGLEELGGGQGVDGVDCDPQVDSQVGGQTNALPGSHPELDMTVDELWRWQMLKQARWGCSVLGYQL